MDSTILTYRHIDLNYLNLMADNDELMKKLMLEMLLNEVPRELEALHYFYELTEWDEVRRISHRIKMLLAFVGNEKLSATNREIEYILRHRLEREKLIGLFQIVDNIYPKVLEELRAEYEGLEALV